MKKFLIFLIVFSLFVFVRIVILGEGSIRIALIQMKVKYGDRKYNTEKAIEMIDRAVEEKIHIACLPEAFDIGWLNENAGNLAEKIPGRTSNRLSECAKRNRIYIIAAGTEQADKAVYNTVYILDKKGNIILKQRKLNIADTGEMTELKIYESGNPVDITIADTDYGKIGISIGSDIIYDEFNVLKKISELRAGIVIIPSAWISHIEKSGDRAKKVGIYIQNLFTEKAEEYNMTLIGINCAETIYERQSGRKYEFIGYSIIANKKGRLIGAGKLRKEEIIIVDIRK